MAEKISPDPFLNIRQQIRSMKPEDLNKLLSHVRTQITPPSTLLTPGAAVLPKTEPVNLESIESEEVIPTADMIWMGAEENEQERKDNLDVYINVDAFNAITDDLSQRGSHLEAGGVILGYRGTDPKTNRLTTKISHYLPISEDKMPATPTSLRFEPDAWSYAAKVMDKIKAESQDQQLEIVGWVHSHPGHGVFLSSNDHFVNKFFQEHGQVAIVYDATKGEFGVFSKGGTLQEGRNGENLFRKHSGFFITVPKNETKKSFNSTPDKQTPTPDQKQLPHIEQVLAVSRFIQASLGFIRSGQNIDTHDNSYFVQQLTQFRQTLKPEEWQQLKDSLSTHIQVAQYAPNLGRINGPSLNEVFEKIEKTAKSKASDATQTLTPAELELQQMLEGLIPAEQTTTAADNEIIPEHEMAAVSFASKYFTDWNTSHTFDTKPGSNFMTELTKLYPTLNPRSRRTLKDQLLSWWHRQTEKGKINSLLELQVNGPSIPEVFEELEKEAQPDGKTITVSSETNRQEQTPINSSAREPDFLDSMTNLTPQQRERARQRKAEREADDAQSQEKLKGPLIFLDEVEGAYLGSDGNIDPNTRLFIGKFANASGETVFIKRPASENYPPDEQRKDFFKRVKSQQDAFQQLDSAEQDKIRSQFNASEKQANNQFGSYLLNEYLKAVFEKLNQYHPS